MLRSDVNQGVINLFEAPSYLEIGVWRGDTFHALQADRKVAVDPNFQFDWRLESSNRPDCSYFECYSDHFFASEQPKLAPYDVIFLDGLHTYEQTLKDLMSAILVINKGGIIIVDDVIPDSYPASLNTYEAAADVRRKLGDVYLNWMGDVYKLAFFINHFMPSFNYYTVKENHGQLVMWVEPGRQALKPSITIEAVSKMSFHDTVIYEEVFRIKPFAEILLAAAERT